jgi:hypothetical protein
MQNRNKVEIKLKKKSLSTKLPTEEWRTVGKMNGTAECANITYFVTLPKSRDSESKQAG